MKVCCKIIVTAIEPAVSLMATNVFQIMIVYSSHMPSFIILLSLMCSFTAIDVYTLTYSSSIWPLEGAVPPFSYLIEEPDDCSRIMWHFDAQLTTVQDYAKAFRPFKCVFLFDAVQKMCWSSMWQCYEDLLMPLTISLSLSPIFPAPSPL